jgi:D-glycero-D-manno-heptose 1,7-bisphosphate phosphatase
MLLRPAVFLDRDGTLNVECGYLTRSEQMRLLPGAAAAVRSLRDSGFACVVVTNQSGIARALLTEDDLQSIHEEMLTQLHAAGAALDAIYHCGSSHDEHPERKPAPGMLLRAARELGLDLERSWIVGDSARDLIAGRRAGCCGGILVRSGHDIAEALALLRDKEHVVADLTAAAHVILASRECTRPKC